MKFPQHIVAVGALVTDNDSNILLARHPDRGWEIPGGYVNIGEDLITALKREIKEETGIDVTVGALAGIHQNIQAESNQVPTKVIFDFLANKQQGELRTSDEHLEVKWFSRDEVLSRITHPIYHDRMRHLINFPGKVLLRVYSKEPYQIHKEQYI
jgi:8-oxo-dGTP diphosphatase